MGYEIPGHSVGCYPADADLTNAQFLPAYVATAVNTTGYGQGAAAVVTTPNAQGTALGILQNNPQLHEAAHVMVSGVTKAKAAGTIALGDPIGQGSGGVIKAVATKFAFGRALEAAVAGDIFSMELVKLGVQS